MNEELMNLNNHQYSLPPFSFFGLLQVLGETSVSLLCQSFGAGQAVYSVFLGI